MRRAALQLSLLGLLLTSAATLPNKGDWDIYSFHINATVNSRYATTVINSRVVNRAEESKEIEFHVQIPKNAFISKFRMLMDGEVYDGVVKTKEQAQQQYTDAVTRGESAGIVSSVGRTMEDFKTSVTVAPHKKVTFELTYEELVKRMLGKYELQIHARPMQPVKDFKIDVHIHEKAGISFIDLKGGLSTGALANAITKTHVDKQAWVHFYPTVDQQKTCDSCGEQGMNGDLIITYDVNRDTELGDLKALDGYFVHHFSPSGLPQIPKNVVFLIDRSGSMSGRKMTQTRTALIHILNDLADEDFFGIITFDGSIFHWKRELVQATSENLLSAKEFAKNIRDRGATNINAAVLDGASMLNAHPREGSASILILLTDGDPTAGETNLERIQSNAKEAIAGKFPLYCLGFGFDVNFEFLEKMSLQNNGVARRIYEDSDADLQLKGFYEEVATPLLTDVTMIYEGGANLTQTNFSQYYNGSEIVVAGQITDNNIETFVPQVLAISKNRKMTFCNTSSSIAPPPGTVPEGLLQRIWAYLTVKQLLDKELMSSGAEKEEVKKEALELSLKYSFVTPLTSMVVTKPQGENTAVLHKPKEGPMGDPGIAYSPPRFRSSGPLHRHHDASGIAYSPPRFGSSGVRGGLPGLAGPDYRHHDASVKYALSRPRPTFRPLAQPAPISHRFLLKTESPSPPVCFDVSGTVSLKLLHHPTRELSVNGKLDSVTNAGFRKIVIHAKSDVHIEVKPVGVDVRQGQSETRHTGEDVITAGSVTVIMRDSEIDVAAEDVRLVIYIREEKGKKFLWPVLRQKTSADNTEGILALKPAVYDEVQDQHSTKLRINGQEISAANSTAVDYSIASPLEMRCWLVSADVILQRSLNDFLVSQL
ncbi:inter-alpha-trypsin inhibitor heavy chain H3-like isoform X2 [Cololabis saira]|uniref:inter-alpha-trypsin inhibitor heavy chain H3-like isoform X2 n=1 Tax=Cololabis saira TaxID=129043 RepID=UPI002AD48095|nr:inter-alpha-trypsin inhibitor heavy chain H3-like isoform X2 [Cololabis saira]